VEDEQDATPAVAVGDARSAALAGRDLLREVEGNNLPQFVGQ
jgi:hypothetical protein